MINVKRDYGVTTATQPSGAAKCCADFLKNQIDFAASRDAAKLENTEIASQGAAVTVRVRCLQPVPPGRGSHK